MSIEFRASGIKIDNSLLHWAAGYLTSMIIRPICTTLVEFLKALKRFIWMSKLIALTFFLLAFPPESCNADSNASHSCDTSAQLDGTQISRLGVPPEATLWSMTLIANALQRFLWPRAENSRWNAGLRTTPSQADCLRCDLFVRGVCASVLREQVVGLASATGLNSL
jgi:hypothetical protein